MRRAMIILLALSLLFLTGCGVYGHGESVGYITTLEDDWDTFVITNGMWFRADLSTSQTDCYRIDPMVVSQAKVFQEAKQKVRIFYERHFMQFGCSNDRVVKIEPIYEVKEQ